MGALFSLIYGLVAYVLCLTTLFYSIGFTGNVLVPKSIDTGVAGPLLQAVVVDLCLLTLFAVQHSVMARQGFKRWWSRIVPRAVERSTYVLAASAALGLLLWQWRPIPEPVLWAVGRGPLTDVLRALFALGWAGVLVSTFLIDHFELFGLRQVVAHLTGRELPEPRLRTPLFYRWVRHPIYVGFLLAFWAAPVMTAGHLLFSVGATGFILVGIWFEERDLVAQFGEQYRRYRREVGMLVPGRRAP